MNIIKNRYVYFLISLLVIIPGIIFMGMHWVSTGEGPLTLGIDFKGGSLLEVQFAGTRPSVADVTALYNQFSTPTQPIADPVVQPLGDTSYSIRSKQMDDATKGKLVAAMAGEDRLIGDGLELQLRVSLHWRGGDQGSRRGYSHGGCRDPALHLVCLPRRGPLLPLWDGGHHRHVPRCTGRVGRGSHARLLPALGSRCPVPHRRA